MRRALPFLTLAALASCAHPKAAARPGPTTAAAPAAATPAAIALKDDSPSSGASDEACGLINVHFAFNSAEIDTADRPALERSARCLKADHALHVTLEGNADERGTEEYNLALGDKRATAVARYLSALGASTSQLATVSFGKENPLCTEHDEACWAQNRRVSLTPKGEAAVPLKR